MIYLCSLFQKQAGARAQENQQERKASILIPIAASHYFSGEQMKSGNKWLARAFNLCLWNQTVCIRYLHWCLFPCLIFWWQATIQCYPFLNCSLCALQYLVQLFKYCRQYSCIYVEKVKLPESCEKMTQFSLFDLLTRCVTFIVFYMLNTEKSFEEILHSFLVKKKKLKNFYQKL